MSGSTAAFTALVLAGRRGPSDEFADALAAADASGHHALLDVAGVPMLVRVVRTLKACPCIDRILVSIDEPAVLAGVPELAAALDDGSLGCHTALDSPSRSVHDVLTGTAAGEQVLVVTADHALLTPEMVEHVAKHANGGDDLLVALVAATTLRAAYPKSRRTYLKLRDDWFSGANLFAFLTPAAAGAAEFWVRAERFRKQPWKLVSTFGPISLLLFLSRRLSLDAAFERISRALGVRVRAVRMPWAEAAIDVDRSADLELVSRILADRASDPKHAPGTGTVFK